MQALGVKVELGPESIAKCVEEVGIAFMYAPRYHPAMKAVAPVRRSLKVRRCLLCFYVRLVSEVAPNGILVSLLLSFSMFHLHETRLSIQSLPLSFWPTLALISSSPPSCPGSHRL
jgi:hypothetical protein